jgi:hypothetical protein
MPLTLIAPRPTIEKLTGSTVDSQIGVRSFAVTDVGRRRKANEDSFLRNEELNPYVVNRAQIDAFIVKPTKDSARQLKRLLESAVQSAC